MKQRNLEEGRPREGGNDVVKLAELTARADDVPVKSDA